METELPRFRVRWKELDYYIPLRLIIRDWANLKMKWGMMLVPSAMAYKGREIELCIPYRMFVKRLQHLPILEQKAIIEGKAEFEVMKTCKWDRYGLVIGKITPYKEAEKWKEVH
jgi:hypothetical protein